MRKPFAVAGAVLATLSFAGAAFAAAPFRETIRFPYAFVDTATCGFPIEVEGVFTNAIIDSTLATGTGTLQLHQSDVATLTANGVTLQVDARYTIFVTFVDGVPVTAKHAGVLDSLRGPNGEHIFFRTGQAVYEVVFDPELGFYVDGPQIVRHGIRDELGTAEFCAAFD